ncbi:enolase [Patescibacteria group bacterium]|nr:enolase [Patescibacteria group bacterium]
MNKNMIKNLKAREILNSRGDSTIEVELETNHGVFRASVPSGASTGKNEAVEIKASKAVENVNKIIARKLKGLNERKQKKIDQLLIKLDGTKDKSKLGANAILAVSVAVCRAGAGAEKKPLYNYIKRLSGGWRKISKMPRPCFNVINGGVHAGNKLDIQEFMIIPQERTFIKNLRTGALIYHDLEEEIEEKYGGQSTNLGDEGGFSPEMSDAVEVLKLLKKVIKKINVKIGIDVAASQLKKPYDIKFYADIIEKYPISFIEDPFDEDDDKSFAEITDKLGKEVLIIGDDFLTTNVDRMRLAYCKKACNGMIIKPNQIGTVTETLQAIKLAKHYKWKIIVSHRSGETNDDFIADLAVGVKADYIKSGAPARGERLVKYNRLSKIEIEINK